MVGDLSAREAIDVQMTVRNLQSLLNGHLSLGSSSGISVAILFHYMLNDIQKGMVYARS